MARIHHKQMPEGILFDTGTQKRIPFALWYDPETGEYSAIRATEDGRDYACDRDMRHQVYEARSVGKLEFIPMKQAQDMRRIPPQRVFVPYKHRPMDERQKLAGLDQYKKVFVEVWTWRGESGRAAQARFDEFLDKSSFLDAFILKRRHVRAS